MDDFDMQIRLIHDGHLLGVSHVVSTHVKNQSLKEFFSHMTYMGRVRNRYFRKYGAWYLKFSPMAMEMFWVLFSLASGKFRLLPYHVVNGLAQTIGFVSGS